MNTRICSVIAVMSLMSFSVGCGGMRNFLFGRGARCGLCNRNAPEPQFGNTMQAPCGAPRCQGAPQGGCGCNGQAYSAQPCGTCGSTAAGDCGCGGMTGTYGSGNYGTVDPYMSGGAVPSAIPQNGTVIAPPGTMIQSDGFSARKFDNDGSRILWEEPVGTNSL
ncbi:MAG: hypothetical protein ACR2NZ_07945 [Rubripirellula sp.]